MGATTDHIGNILLQHRAEVMTAITRVLVDEAKGIEHSTVDIEQKLKHADRLATMQLEQLVEDVRNA